MTDERQQDPSVDLSFPIAEEQGSQRSVTPEPEAVDHVPRLDHDVVDTDWDIPMITFPHDLDMGDHGTSGDAEFAPKPRVASSQHAGNGFIGVPQTGEQTGSEQRGESAGSSAGSGDAEGERTLVLGSGLHALNPDDAQLNPWDAQDGHANPGNHISSENDEFSDIVRMAGAQTPGAGVPPQFRDADAAALPPQGLQRRRILAVIILMAVCVALIAAVATWLVKRHGMADAHRQAVVTCTAAVRSYTTADASLRTALDNVKAQQSLKAAQVHDGSTIDTLSKTIANARAQRLSATQRRCDESSSAGVLDKRARDARSAVVNIRSSVTAVTKAAADVRASKAQRDSEITSARQEVNASIAQAVTLLNSSQNQVDENATRVTLETAVSAARQAVANDNAYLDTLHKVKNDLDTAQVAVNQSMSAYAAQQSASQNAAPVAPVAPAAPASPSVPAPRTPTRDTTKSDEDAKDSGGDGDNTEPPPDQGPSPQDSPGSQGSGAGDGVQ